MKFNTIIPVIVALIVAGGFYYFLQNRPQEGGAEAIEEEQAVSNDLIPSTATSYEECIAEGNAPLPDAPDKCLTTDGHLFIQMPEEESN